MSGVAGFLSHSSCDSRQAVAVKNWLIEQEPGLAEEIFLDLDPHTGIPPRGMVEAGVAAGQFSLRGGDLPAVQALADLA